MLLEQLCLGADIAKGEVFFWEQIAVGAVLSGNSADIDLGADCCRSSFIWEQLLFSEQFYLRADCSGSR